jgi:hypothetical protein
MSKVEEALVEVELVVERHGDLRDSLGRVGRIVEEALDLAQQLGSQAVAEGLSEAKDKAEQLAGQTGACSDLADELLTTLQAVKDTT